jgi:hypothetical protein
MAGLLDYVGALQPQVVLTAPDGSQLWVDATPRAGPPSPLWPQGFTASVRFGAPPAGVSTSPGRFFLAQGPTLLRAPGPFGVPWWGWLAGLGVLAALPYLPLLLSKGRKPAKKPRRRRA